MPQTAPKNGRRGALRGGGLIRGLRLEPDLARALTAYAQTQAQAHGTDINMASAARDLLRLGLKLCSGRHSCDREGYFAGVARAKQEMATAVHEAFEERG